MKALSFRGKSLKSGEWLTGALNQFVNNGQTSYYIMQTGFDWAKLKTDAELDDYAVDPITIGEFTGVFDTAGEPIYEGDIIRADYLAILTGTVVLEDGAYGLEIFNGSTRYFLSLQSLSYTTMHGIGNIHDLGE